MKIRQQRKVNAAQLFGKSPVRMHAIYTDAQNLSI
jgi:hypothetical protein